MTWVCWYLRWRTYDRSKLRWLFFRLHDAIYHKTSIFKTMIVEYKNVGILTLFGKDCFLHYTSTNATVAVLLSVGNWTTKKKQCTLYWATRKLYGTRLHIIFQHQPKIDRLSLISNRKPHPWNRIGCSAEWGFPIINFASTIYVV